MRDRNVLGFIPRISAAPFLPWITQPVSFKARSDVMALDVFKRINRLLDSTMRLKHGIIDIRDRTAGENHSPLDDVL